MSKFLHVPMRLPPALAEPFEEYRLKLQRQLGVKISRNAAALRLMRDALMAQGWKVDDPFIENEEDDAIGET
jgi:hypothetical protein